MNIKIHPLNDGRHRIKMIVSKEVTLSLSLLLPEIEDLEGEITNIICQLAKYRKEQAE
jgi:hypothetical protein